MFIISLQLAHKGDEFFFEIVMINKIIIHKYKLLYKMLYAKIQTNYKSYYISYPNTRGTLDV